MVQISKRQRSSSSTSTTGSLLPRGRCIRRCRGPLLFLLLFIPVMLLAIASLSLFLLEDMNKTQAAQLVATTTTAQTQKEPPPEKVITPQNESKPKLNHPSPPPIPPNSTASFTLNCAINHTSATFQKASFQPTWHQIDQFISSDNVQRNEKRSGGIFLYPRQSHLLQHLLHSLKNNLESSQLQRRRPIQICETGFAAGHSSALFLSTDKDVNVVTFDTFDRTYQIPIVEQLVSKYNSSRLVYVKGDSCKTVPQFMEHHHHLDDDESKNKNVNSKFIFPCNILHGSSLCPTDNIDLVAYAAPCGTILTSTAMNSVQDQSVYFGSRAQWRKLRNEGCIDFIRCFTEEAHVLEDKYVFAKKKNVEVKHEFCVGVVTGRCYKYNNNDDEENGNGNGGNVGCDVTESVRMYQDICPNWSIEVPS